MSGDIKPAETYIIYCTGHAGVCGKERASKAQYRDTNRYSAGNKGQSDEE